MASTVLITGGTRGIGRACSELFYERGYNVAALYKSHEKNAEMFLSGKEFSRVMAVQADVSDYDAVMKAVSEITRKLGRIDVLINNAGISRQGMLNDITPEEWDEMFAVNTKGMFNCVKACMDSMIHSKYGRIINISSMWGVSGASCEVPYSASKAAVIGFTKALAKELGPSGITVNCVAPGVIDTDMNAALTEADMNALAEETPLMRIGSPSDPAGAVLFFASDAASFVTGQTLCVDGGFTL